MTERAGIGIVRISPPHEDRDASRKAIQNLVALSADVFDDVVVFDNVPVDQPNVQTRPVEKVHRESVVAKVLYHLLFQVRLSLAIVQHRRQLDVTFWHAGGYSLVLPMLVARAIGIRTVLAVIGEPTTGFQNEEYWGRRARVLARMSSVLERVAYTATDRIVVFSESMTEYELLSGFEEKTYELRFNFERVPPDQSPVSERDNRVLYLGRICALKGADVLAEATEILASRSGCPVESVVFVGDGELCADLENSLTANEETADLVEFTGWVSDDEAMDHLRAASVLTLPSESEGLPKAVQEAMARGVVPVVTPVGSLPDIVRDGENGVLLDDDDPETVARAIVRALEDDDTLSTAARKTVEREFGYETVRARFEEVVGIGRSDRT